MINNPKFSVDDQWARARLIAGVDLDRIFDAAAAAAVLVGDDQWARARLIAGVDLDRVFDAAAAAAVLVGDDQGRVRDRLLMLILIASSTPACYVLAATVELLGLLTTRLLMLFPRLNGGNDH